MNIITSLKAIKWASRNGHTEIVKHLLNDSRVDPSAQDNFGKTGNNLNEHK